jgi:hypothetical protein
MRRLVVLSLAATALAATAGQANAQQVPRHFHSLETPSGETHTIAQGLTASAPCQAFLNFHAIVHTEVFGVVDGAEGTNPLGPLTAQVVQPMEFCP